MSLCVHIHTHVIWYDLRSFVSPKKYWMYLLMKRKRNLEDCKLKINEKNMGLGVERLMYLLSSYLNMWDFLVFYIFNSTVKNLHPINSKSCLIWVYNDFFSNPDKSIIIKIFHRHRISLFINLTHSRSSQECLGNTKVWVAKINANVHELSLVLRKLQGPLTQGLFTL